jgi:hypothetical protein
MTTNFGVASALGLGLGSWVLADAHNVPEAGDPNATNPVGRTGAKAIGVGLLAAGGVALVGGIATILRGSDLREDLGTSKHIRQTTIVACNEGPVPNVRVDVVQSDSELPETASFMGKTASDGQLRIPKDAFRPFFNFFPARETAQLRIGSTLADVDLRGIRAALASDSAASALSLARNDQAEEAEAALKFAAQLGADVGSAQTALDAAPSRLRRLVEAKQEHDRKWGRNIKDWGLRPANEHAYRILRSVLASLYKRKELRRQWSEEKQKNDTAETPDEFIPAEVVPAQLESVPLFPQTSGPFEFVKILSQRGGDALFEANDGLFVLHLSPGDSFDAYPGQSVQMSIHRRGGESMLMSDGQRLPVFRSGASPVRMRTIPGHRTPERRIRGNHPNRSKEKALKKRLDIEERALEHDYSTNTQSEAGGNRILKDSPVGVTITFSGESGSQVDNIFIGSLDPAYCVEVDRLCAKGKVITVSMEELIGK